MSHSGDDDRDVDESEELGVLLAELEQTLAELRSAVEDDVRDGNGEKRERRGDVTPSRRPPTPGDILRFTEQYTIPTLVALLEATVQALELLRAVLRLAGPQPTEDRLRDSLESPDSPDVATLRDALADLRAALTGADLPEESTAASVLADARSLTAEIDDRLASAGDERADTTETEDRSRSTTDERGVAIDVREEDGTTESTADGVDVDAELESIKESLDEDDRPEG
jgi:hypothetical protein